jgi:hypothetical protein
MPAWVRQGRALLLLPAAVIVALLAPAVGLCQDDEDLLDLDSLGSYESDTDSGSEGASFGGTNALFSGTLLTKFGQDIRKDNGEEYLISDLTYATAKAAVTVNPNLAVTLEGLFRYELQANEYHTATEYEFSLWEATARWKLGAVDLTVGQGQVAWGLADAINPTDTINPRNYDRFLDPELGFTKQPAPMARLEWYMPKNIKLDAVVLPFFVPAQISIVGNDVALMGHQFPLFMLLGEVRENPDWGRLEKGLSHWYPQWEEDLQGLLEDEEFYRERWQVLDDDFSHAEGAMRLSGRAGTFDFSASYHYLWDDIPTLHVNPEFLDLLQAFSDTPEDYQPVPTSGLDVDTIMEPFTIMYHRSHAFGADLGTMFQGVGIRAEGLWQTAKYVYTDSFGTRRKPVANWVLNIDYMFAGNFLVTGMFMQSAIIGETSGLMMPPSYDLLMLVLRKPWLDDKITTDLAFAYDFSYLETEDWNDFAIFGEDGMVAPMVTYAITDPLKIALGANIVWGENYTLLGILKEESRVFTTLSYDF